MSQAKVDKRKEEKRDRKKLMAREKRTRIIWAVVGGAIAVALILFIVFSIINKII